MEPRGRRRILQVIFKTYYYLYNSFLYFFFSVYLELDGMSDRLYEQRLNSTQTSISFNSLDFSSTYRCKWSCTFVDGCLSKQTTFFFLNSFHCDRLRWCFEQSRSTVFRDSGRFEPAEVRQRQRRWWRHKRQYYCEFLWVFRLLIYFNIYFKLRWAGFFHQHRQQKVSDWM